MKKIVITIFLLTTTFLTNAQTQTTYYVESNQGFEQPVLDKLTEFGKSITTKQETSTYTIKCLTTKTGMGRAKGSIIIANSKSGVILAQSPQEKGQTSAFNGYANPQLIAIKKAASEHLATLLAKCSN